MSIVASWLILASVLTAHSGAAASAAADLTGVRYPAAVELFHCDFDPAEVDRDQDGWPQDWRRRTGVGYPHYVDMEVVEAPSPGNDHCLRIALDGGAATAYSPPVDVSMLSSYVVEGWLKTDGLVHDEALLSVTLLDAQRHPLERFESRMLRHSEDWVKLRIGPFAPASAAAVSAVIGIEVRPGSEEDLTGTVWCDDVWMGLLPRVTLDTSPSRRWITPEEDIEVVCAVSGALSPDAVCTFRIEDALGEVLESHEQRLSENDDFGDAPPGTIARGTSTLASLKRTFRMRPQLDRTGLYRVYAHLHGGDGLSVEHELNIAVTDDAANGAGGEFGWSLPRGDTPLSQAELLMLASQVGIGKIKYPVWVDPANSEALEQLAWFVERLNSRGVEVIGLLQDPPQAVIDALPVNARWQAADVFTAPPESWYPSLEPVVSRLAMRVRQWQLGGDYDQSFQGAAGIEPLLLTVRRRLDEVGQGVQLGVGWNWLEQLPQWTDSTAYAVSLSAQPPLTHTELAEQLADVAHDPTTRWIDVTPLRRDEYTTEARARDLVLRMAAAKVHGANGIFLSDPFDAQRGVLTPEGNPAELIFAWRTTARLLAGAEYLGEMQLPGGSRNHVFARGDETVMLVWSDGAVAEEVLYLGEAPRWVDVWGRSGPVSEIAGRHVIDVSNVPRFVTGLDQRVTRLRMAVQLAPEALAPSYGRPQRCRLVLRNPLDDGVNAHVRLELPARWKCTPEEFDLTLAAHAKDEVPLEIMLPVGASAGVHQVRADVQLASDREYRYSVYRTLEVGDGRLTIDVATRTTPDGDLVVEQLLTNHSDDVVSLRCYLRGADMHFESRQVRDFGPGINAQQYVVAGGANRVGQSMLIQVSEVLGDSRTLYHWFTVEP
ncbi:MAG: hypothetical protein R3C10_07775 [Pirellulales bacterium]